MALEQLLQRTPALANASRDALSRLAKAATVRSHQRGDLLWRAGDTPRSFTVVKSGLVKVVRSGASGRRTICGMFGPPQSIGDVVLVKQVPYPADAIVGTEVASVITIPREVFISCVESCPPISVSIACAIHEKLMSLHCSIEVLSAGSVEARLATALLNLYAQYGDDFDDGTSSIPVALSRRELSDLISTSVETVIRIMTRWEREGVLSTEDHGFTIRDARALAVAAGRDSTEHRAAE